MSGDSLFIQLVDHRVSTALIFFLLMVLLNNRKLKQKFGLRAVAAFVAMCAVSWILRTIIDVGAASEIVQGLEYSIYTIVMSLMFLFGYAFCYYTTPGELVYIDLLALTIVKMAWNSFKAGSYAADLFGMPNVWSRYSELPDYGRSHRRCRGFVADADGADVPRLFELSGCAGFLRTCFYCGQQGIVPLLCLRDGIYGDQLQRFEIGCSAGA